MFYVLAKTVQKKIKIFFQITFWSGGRPRKQWKKVIKGQPEKNFLYIYSIFFFRPVQFFAFLISKDIILFQ